MTKGKYNKGFTLVELLVVIAIIAILAGALLMVINPASLLMKGRDSTRMSDLSTINRALTMAVAENKITIGAMGTTAAGNGTFTSCTGTASSGTTAVDGSNGWVRGFTIVVAPGLGGYIARLPLDPTNTGTLCYWYDSQAQAAGVDASWELNTVLEHVDNATIMTNDGGNNNARYEIGTDVALNLI